MRASLDVALRGRRGDFVLDIAFAASEVTALLGPSGSGKTSVLRAIAGLDRYAGTVRFGDEVWQDAHRFVPPHRRRVGYVAQGGVLLPHLTVAANLAYAARRASPGPFEQVRIITATRIGALLSRYPDQLSGGEGQRAAIARAFLGQPQLLLLDEPLSGVDAEGRDDLLAALSTLFADAALPVIYVTHDAAEAARLAMATIQISAGRLAGGVT